MSTILQSQYFNFPFGEGDSTIASFGSYTITELEIFLLTVTNNDPIFEADTGLGFEIATVGVLSPQIIHIAGVFIPLGATLGPFSLGKRVFYDPLNFRFDNGNLAILAQTLFGSEALTNLQFILNISGTVIP